MQTAFQTIHGAISLSLQTYCKSCGLQQMLFPASDSFASIKPIFDLLLRNEEIIQKDKPFTTRSLFSRSAHSDNPDKEGDSLSKQECTAIIKTWLSLSGSKPNIASFLFQSKKLLKRLPMPFAGMNIPVYEFSRIASALACCTGENASSTSTIALYSIDLSGIQSFLYSIGNRGALKGLKTRSFYLSILTQHIADTILERLHLTPINLLFCGGGKAHLLIPGTKIALQSADEAVHETNQFLMQHFGVSLFLARGYAVATLEELFSEKKNDFNGFSNLFGKAIEMISEAKQHRYSIEDIFSINARPADENERECAVCGTSRHLSQYDEDLWLCSDCIGFEQFSSVLNESSARLMICENAPAPCLHLPLGKDLGLCPYEPSISSIRSYAINREPLDQDWYLPVGNAQPQDKAVHTFEELAAASQGIPRLGVFRMDVDNLGSLFSGHFSSLAEYCTLSATITDFFQNQINSIAAGRPASCSLGLQAKTSRNISIVYSGGDDIFLVGAWNEALDSGLSIAEAFREYSHGQVSISGGFGIFPDHYPIRQMAADCAVLEDAAKQMPGKNAVCLFESANALHWVDYTSQVLKEMLPIISLLAGENAVNGNTFLYHVLETLRLIQKDQKGIEIARLAYTLARHCPDSKSDNPKIKEKTECYNHASCKLYEWALEREQNKKLQLAIQLYVYLHREGNQE